jgi:sterol desaturase/sphingolipid hydroxylase (fatty acid hydroxylase superfamily)
VNIESAHAAAPARKSVRSEGMLSKILYIGGRVLIAAAILWMIATIPLPALDWELVVAVRVPIAIFIFIVYVGKILYDTFFYQRQP